MNQTKRTAFFILFIFILLTQITAESMESLSGKLAGSWIRTEEDNARIIYFDMPNNELTFYNRNDALEETYKWSAITKSRQSDTLNISGTNDMIPILKMTFSVQFTSDDTILLYSAESGIKNESIGWDGEYRKMTEQTASVKRKPALPELSGEFKGETMKLDFQEDSFTLHTSDKNTQGKFTVYQSDETTVLDLQFSSASGVYERTEYYAMTYEMELNNDEKELTQTLTLKKGKMSPAGFIPAGDEKIILTNISEITSDRDTGAAQEILDAAD